MKPLLNQEKANKALHANLTPRYCRLDKLERYVDGTQYDGRPSFWDDGHPLMERKPIYVYPIVETGIRSNSDLVLGEDRWPDISSFGGEDDSVFDKRFGVSADDSVILDRYISALVEQSRLKAMCRELLHSAMATGTGASIVAVRGGKMCVDNIKAKWCTPTFDKAGNVTKLEIQYPYLHEYWDSSENRWAVECLLYRRVVDEVDDTTFLPLEASPEGEPPVGWRVDEELSGPHGLGFCPVNWYRFLPRCRSVDEIDGDAVHKTLLDEIDCLNFAISQRHRAAMTATDPILIEIGVNKDEQVGDVGRTVNSQLASDYKHDGTSKAYGYGSGGAPARKRGPGQAYRYESKDAKVDQLTLPGDALRASDENIKDLREKLSEALAVVFIDPNKLANEAKLSGKAISRMRDPQVRFCDKVREDFGDNCLLKLIDMMLRVSLVVSRGDKGLFIPGLDKVTPILKRFEQPVDELGMTWFSPHLDLAWGDYFEPDPQEEEYLVRTAVLAYTNGFITKRTAVDAMSELYVIGDIDEYLRSLEEDNAAKLASDVEKTAKLAIAGAAGTPNADGSKPKTPSGPGGSAVLQTKLPTGQGFSQNKVAGGMKPAGPRESGHNA